MRYDLAGNGDKLGAAHTYLRGAESPRDRYANARPPSPERRLARANVRTAREQWRGGASAIRRALPRGAGAAQGAPDDESLSHRETACRARAYTGVRCAAREPTQPRCSCHPK
ncbi:unnamed protein product, partial [Iphiclides podalirius]